MFTLKISNKHIGPDDEDTNEVELTTELEALDEIENTIEFELNLEE
jgi:hypothetical protein